MDGSFALTSTIGIGFDFDELFVDFEGDFDDFLGDLAILSEYWIFGFYIVWGCQQIYVTCWI